MFISLTRWKTEGLRCPDMEVNFLTEERALSKVNLILMPNGTGKSTITDLIECALTNRQLSPSQVKQFCGEDNQTGRGSFEIGIGRSTSDQFVEKETEIFIDLFFDTGEMRYSTFLNEASGRESGWRPHSDLLPFLRKNCVEVFVFKGDKADNLLKNDRNDAEAALKAYFGIDWVKDALDRIDAEFRGRINSRVSSSTSNERQLAGLRRDIEEWESRKDLLRKELQELNSTKSSLETGISEIEEEYQSIQQQDGDLAATREAAKEEVRQADQKVLDASTEVMNAIRNPYYLSEEFRKGLHSLKDNLVKLRLPGASRVFFEEYVESEDDCICGRPLDEDSKNNILINAKSFLGDDEVNVVNAIKRDIGDQADKFTTDGLLGALFQDLKKSAEQLNQAKRREQLAQRSINEAASTSQREILSKYGELSGELRLIEEKISAIDDVSKATSSNITVALDTRKPAIVKNMHVVEGALNLLYEKLSDSLNAGHEVKAKELLHKILSEASESALNKIKDDIVQDSNAKLASILTAGSKVRISKIEKNLKIAGVRGEQGGASGGETASIAYSFATSILDETGVQFPLVVDHPVTAVMIPSRTPLAETILGISHQFIAFLIDAEREGFVEPFLESSSVSYHTIFRRLEGNLRHEDSLPNDNSLFSKTKNGVVCTDKEFFIGF